MPPIQYPATGIAAAPSQASPALQSHDSTWHLTGHDRSKHLKKSWQANHFPSVRRRIEKCVTVSPASFKSIPSNKKTRSTESLLSLLHVGAALVYREGGASLTSNWVLTSRQRESQRRNVPQKPMTGSVFKKNNVQTPRSLRIILHNNFPKICVDLFHCTSFELSHLSAPLEFLWKHSEWHSSDSTPVPYHAWMLARTCHSKPLTTRAPHSGSTRKVSWCEETWETRCNTWIPSKLPSLAQDLKLLLPGSPHRNAGKLCNAAVSVVSVVLKPFLRDPSSPIAQKIEILLVDSKSQVQSPFCYVSRIRWVVILQPFLKILKYMNSLGCSHKQILTLSYPQLLHSSIPIRKRRFGFEILTVGFCKIYLDESESIFLWKKWNFE